MKEKYRLSKAVLLMGLMLGIASFILPSSAAAGTVWKMQQIYGPTNYQSIELKRFAKDVTVRTKGDLTIEVFDGGGLGVPWNNALTSLQSGAISIIEIPVAYMGGQDRFFGLEYLPLLITSVGEHCLAMDSIYGLRVQEFAKFNVIPVAHWPYQNQTFVSKKPLRTLADFKGKRLRSTSPEDALLIKALGGIPVTMPMTDVYLTAQRGGLDGYTTAPSGMVGMSAWEVFGYFNEISWGMAGSVILVNKDAYHKLSGETRSIFLEEVYKLQEQMHALVKENYKADSKKLIDKGMKRVVPSPDLIAHMKKIAPAIWEEWAKKAGPVSQSGLNKIRTVLDK
ncbi:MAG: hypothetical protein C3F14_04860 [Deltaproteobacteria bacterium]|nr:MAG: hypothetical protein C3F14_04860 [Deltaproteobacteria bacterium]